VGRVVNNCRFNL